MPAWTCDTRPWSKLLTRVEKGKSLEIIASWWEAEESVWEEWEGKAVWRRGKKSEKLTESRSEANCREDLLTFTPSLPILIPLRSTLDFGYKFGSIVPTPFPNSYFNDYLFLSLFAECNATIFRRIFTRTNLQKDFVKEGKLKWWFWKKN